MGVCEKFFLNTVNFVDFERKHISIMLNKICRFTFQKHASIKRFVFAPTTHAALTWAALTTPTAVSLAIASSGSPKKRPEIASISTSVPT